MAASNKRARGADILSSLDAAFASSGQVAASKYTSQAVARVDQAAQQQAYAHKRKRGGKKKPGSDGHAGGRSSATGGKSDGQAKRADTAGPATRGLKAGGAAEDPLYRRMDANLLAIGLRSCSLQSQASALSSTSALNAVLKNYLAVSSTKVTSYGNGKAAAATGPSAAVADKLKNKILQLDNPIRTSDAAKRAGNAALAQTAKLMSARQRRKVGLHLLRGDMQMRDAEQLSAIWLRYARDQLGNDFAEGGDDNLRQQNARVHAKLSAMDLSGCPFEVIRSRNPCNVGIHGIIVAETRQVLQVCCTPTGKIRNFPKAEVTARIRLSDAAHVVVDSAWLASRQQKVVG